MSTATARVAPEKADFRPALPSRLFAGALPESGMATLSYREQLRHPNWQRLRLEAMQRAGFKCEKCGTATTTLNVHHKRYVQGRLAWEYALSELEVLCEPCHEAEHGLGEAGEKSSADEWREEKEALTKLQKEALESRPLPQEPSDEVRDLLRQALGPWLRFPPKMQPSRLRLCCGCVATREGGRWVWQAQLACRRHQA
jgi:hypothetical protein